MRYFINRASFYLCVVCVGMLLIYFVIDAAEWGSSPGNYPSGCFGWAWLLAILNHITTPNKPRPHIEHP